MKSAFDYKALGCRIRKSRKALNLTQEQLAEACDLSTAHIGHIERGTRALSIESLITLADVLNVSTDYLLLDISASSDKNLSGITNLLSNIDSARKNTFYSLVKILAENIDSIR